MRRVLLATAFIGLGTAVSAQPAPAPQSAPQKNSCFFVNQFQTWKAPDAKTIYIRVDVSRYYRLDLANECPMILWPDSHLILNVHGPDTICSAIDWDLSVNQSPRTGGPVGCIVKKMTQLSPQEAAAIPPKFKP